MANIKKSNKQEISLVPKTNQTMDSDSANSQPAVASKRMAIISGITKEINKTRGEKIAYNLKTDDDAPTSVRSWFSTSAIKLDYIISNKRGGGIPEGRIIEVFGEPSSGKSTLAQTICAQAQKNGAIAVYIDSENATSIENLSMLGVNVNELIFVQEQCIEDTFQLIEQIITSVKNQDNSLPVIIVWDSIAASVSRTELEATYEQQQIGIKARALSKGIMKVNQILKDKRVTLILVNQTRQKIGVIGSDPCVSPDTKIKIRKTKNVSNIMNVTFKQLFQENGLQSFDEVGMLNIEGSEIEIESYDLKTKTKCWKRITDLVVKNKSETHYRLGSLKGTAEHKVLYKNKWVKLKDHPFAKLINEPIEVLDLCVEDTHNYIAEGQINHNTTTPGGMAVPFAASVRLRVYTPQKIKETIEKQEVIKGIQVRVATIKNKVARPYRQAELQIIYDKGINDYEILFDDLRVFCESPKFKENREKYSINGIVAVISGAGAWKKIELIDCLTGEIKTDKNFYKSDFCNIFNDEKFNQYIFMLCDGSYILKDSEKDTLTSASAAAIDEHSVD